MNTFYGLNSSLIWVKISGDGYSADDFVLVLDEINFRKLMNQGNELLGNGSSMGRWLNMWTPVDIFALCFLFNLSPDVDARLSVKEANQNNILIESVVLRKD